jgi:hypothetical protein
VSRESGKARFVTYRYVNRWSYNGHYVRLICLAASGAEGQDVAVRGDSFGFCSPITELGRVVRYYAGFPRLDWMTR